MQFSDEQYFDISDLTYGDVALKINKIHTLEHDRTKWITINSVDEPSGLQAIAVVPLKDYEDLKAGKISTYPNVVFATRGSEQFLEDWLGADVGELAINATPEKIKKDNMNMDKVADSLQFLGYERFVDQTLEKYNVTDYSFTGHSLGGALAQYLAAIKDKNATTFAAARAYRLLPPEIKAKVDAGYYNDKIVDYRHKYDPVGYLPGGKIIGSQYLVKSSNADIPVMGHLGSSFKDSFKNGSVQILFDPEAIRGISNEMMVHYDTVNDLQLAFRQYIDYEESEIQAFVNNVRTSPEYDQLSPTEIDEILDEMFPYKTSGIYSVHNPEAGENIDTYCRVAKEKMYQLSEQMKKAAEIASNSDKGLAKDIDADIKWFNSLDVSAEPWEQNPSGNRPISS